MRVAMLTTTDNPHSPFDDFRAWYAYDVAAGYHTCDYLGRVTYLSHSLSEADYNNVVEQAIDEIVELNVLGNYVKVVKDLPE